MELYEDTNPITVHNFRVLCTGELDIHSNGLCLHYKNTIFHHIIKEFMCQGGDLTNGKGISPPFGEANFLMKISFTNIQDQAYCPWLTRRTCTLVRLSTVWHRVL
jgi:cyclophilin family peptidyl-prolyl cis-trans isomerase